MSSVSLFQNSTKSEIEVTLVESHCWLTHLRIPASHFEREVDRFASSSLLSSFIIFCHEMSWINLADLAAEHYVKCASPAVLKFWQQGTDRHGMSRHIQKNMLGLSILHDQCKGAEQSRQANWQVWYGVVQNTKYRGLLRSSWSFLTLFFNLLKLALVWCLVRFCIATTKTHNCTQLNTQLNAYQSLVYAILCILH